MSVGEGHSCSLDRSGSFCWGTNILGGLGIGAIDTVRHASAERIVAPLQFAQMDAGQYHTCALTASGQAWCWGWGALGQLGDGTRRNSGTPVPVAGGIRFREISAGGEHTCAISIGNVTYCWGSNGMGQLASNQSEHECGPDGRPCALVPVAIQPALEFRTVSAGGQFTCGVRDSGDAYCWGENILGTLGAGMLSPSEPPIRVNTDASFVSITAGAFHACGLATHGEAWCWGNNRTGQFAYGIASSSLPIRGAPEMTFTHLSAGYLHTCGIASDGTALCWGENKRGQLGTGMTVEFSREPLPVAGDHRFQAISGGIEHSCALDADGDSYCWGGNSYGQLGSGTDASTSVPVKVVARVAP